MIKKAFIAIFFFLAIISIQAYKLVNTFTIHISNIEEVEGVIQIGIYNNAVDFPKVDRQFIVFRENVSSDKLIKKLNALPDGAYAIAIYHDVNNDGICNKNFFGYPKEPFGFSNNVKPVLSAPSFKSASFSIPDIKEIHIKLVQ